MVAQWREEEVKVIVNVSVNVFSALITIMHSKMLNN